MNILLYMDLSGHFVPIRLDIGNKSILNHYQYIFLNIYELRMILNNSKLKY